MLWQKSPPWQEQTAHIQECEVVFGCIDSLAGRGDLEAFARRSMIPLIDIGMDVNAIADGFISAARWPSLCQGCPMITSSVAPDLAFD